MNDAKLLPETQELVDTFALALANKLLRAQIKYGFDKAEWRRDDWQETCRKNLMEHIQKGDPRDVAAYCAFMWYHGWSTAGAPSAPAQPPVDQWGFTAEDNLWLDAQEAYHKALCPASRGFSEWRDAMEAAIEVLRKGSIAQPQDAVPVAWRFRLIEDGLDEWTFSDNNELDFDDPSKWIVQPLYAATPPAPQPETATFDAVEALNKIHRILKPGRPIHSPEMTADCIVDHLTDDSEPAPQLDEEKEREAFEQFVREKLSPMSIEKDKNGRYENAYTYIVWVGWLARARYNGGK